MTPRDVSPDDLDLPAILALIQSAFAPMEGRVNPPSSIRHLTLDRLRDHAARRELWVIDRPSGAAVIATVQTDALYLGKLAVARDRRNLGLARGLVEHLAQHARALGLPCLRLQTRVELTENHAVFAALGFTETARTTHPGFAAPTSLTMERPNYSVSRFT